MEHFYEEPLSALVVLSGNMSYLCYCYVFVLFACFCSLVEGIAHSAVFIACIVSVLCILLLFFFLIHVRSVGYRKVAFGSGTRYRRAAFTLCRTSCTCVCCQSDSATLLIPSFARRVQINDEEPHNQRAFFTSDEDFFDSVTGWRDRVADYMENWCVVFCFIGARPVTSLLAFVSFFLLSLTVLIRFCGVCVVRRPVAVDTVSIAAGPRCHPDRG